MYSPTEADYSKELTETIISSNSTDDSDDQSLMDCEHKIEAEEEILREAFKQFDRLKTGKVSITQFWIVLKEIGEKTSHDEVTQMFNQVNTGGHNSINF